MFARLLMTTVCAAALGTGVPAVHACDLTLSPGQDIQSGLNTVGVNDVCLSPGTYSVSSAITVPGGKTLEGTGSSRDDVVITGAPSRMFYVGNNTVLHNFSVIGDANATEYGVLIYGNTSVTLWSLRIQGTLIGTGVVNSSSVTIADTFYANNGRPGNGLADPNIWIDSSNGVTVNYGELRGAANGPGGDGELSCYDSTSLHVYGVHSVDSGASAFYLVNCDNSTIESTDIERAGEWGLDIVQGTDNFLAQNNQVMWSYYGGSVFDQVNNAGGQYLNNTFTSNDVSGSSSFCNGINVIGSPGSVYMSGNTASPAPVSCVYTP